MKEPCSVLEVGRVDVEVRESSGHVVKGGRADQLELPIAARSLPLFLLLHLPINPIASDKQLVRSQRSNQANSLAR